MTIACDNDTEVGIKDASGQMARMIGEAFARETAPVCRITVRVRRVNPLGWLNRQNAGRKIYWRDRDGKFETAGVGAADLIQLADGADIHSHLHQLQKSLASTDSEVRYFGGHMFDPSQRPEPDWEPFGALCFLLPRFELTRDGDSTRFVCNLLPAEDKGNMRGILEQLEKLILDGDFALDSLPATVGRRDEPQADGWRLMVDKALTDIDRGRFEKIVLARTASLLFDEAPRPLALLAALSTNTPDSYAFCFQPDEQHAFLAVTPERLYRRTGSEISCEAVAGTRPRGDTDELDKKLADELKQSEKDFREHRFVVRSIIEAFKKIGEPSAEQSAVPISLLKLARVQHLVTRFELRLNSAPSDANLLAALHPTAAVGGYPGDGALGAIAQMEPTPRGWYAGPVGWLSANAAEFAVAIRSGLLTRAALRLYSGAGIVNGSQPDDEWNETENKISSFLKALER